MSLCSELSLWRDTRGIAAVEYALILAIVGIAVLVASVTLGSAIGNSQSGAMAWTYTTTPDGVAHQCTANCQMDYQDYRLACNEVNNFPNHKPTFVPALTAAECS